MPEKQHKYWKHAKLVATNSVFYDVHLQVCACTFTSNVLNLGSIKFHHSGTLVHADVCVTNEPSDMFRKVFIVRIFHNIREVFI